MKNVQIKKHKYLNLSRHINYMRATNNSQNTVNSTQIYRFKFTEKFIDQLSYFAKIHQYDDRHMFKEQWDLWVKINNSIVQEEIERLIALQYNGDILDKMYKSARYYFRKKEISKQNNSTQSQIIDNINENEDGNEDGENKRRTYIRLGQEVLTAIDKHIQRNHAEDDYSPANGYNKFCLQNKDILLHTIQEIINNPDIILNGDALGLKIKKTYKNRYYQFTRKQKTNNVSQNNYSELLMNM
jgi:hypothetical protein